MKLFPTLLAISPVFSGSLLLISVLSRSVLSRSVLSGFVLAGLLTGCSNTPEVAQNSTDLSEPPGNSATPIQAQTIPLPAEATEIELPTREFPIETLYSLLVAEIASGRERYEVVLRNYAQEAHRTRDPGVIAHAVRVARYLNAHPVALSTAQLWVEVEPDNTEALFSVSSELAHTGQLMEAFAYSEKLQRLGSTPVFQSIAARASQVTDTQREQLTAEFDRLLQEFPSDVQLLVSKAMLLQAEQPQAALTLVERALTVRDDDIQAAVMEAKLLYQLKRPDAALARLQRLLKQNPDNNLLRLQYARFLTSVDLTEAQQQFEILVTRAPNDGDLLQALGLVAYQRGELDTAEPAFKHLLLLKENMGTAHFYLGQIAEKRGREDDALNHYLAVESGPDLLPALNQGLDILARTGQLQRLHDTMAHWRSVYSEQSERFYLLESQVLMRHKQNDAAETVLNDALNLNANSSDLLYSRAMLFTAKDDIALAEQDLRTIIKYQPNNATALNALGYTLADRTDRHEEALQLIQQALSIRPDDPAIIDSLGWVHFRLGNYEEALLRLRQALKDFPDHEVAAHLGEVLWVTGDTEQARAVWTEGLRLNPESDIIPAVIERLTATQP